MNRSTARYRVGVVAGVLGLALTAAALAPVNGASAVSSPSAALVAAEAAPAVQLVVITYHATVAVPHPRNNLPAQLAAKSRLQSEAANGQLGNSLQAINDQWATDLAKNPGRYLFSGGPVRTTRTTVTATCSGWFVTPTGYLVTAAHCVTKDSTVLADLAGNVLPGYVAPKFDFMLGQWGRGGVVMDQTIRHELHSFVTKWFEENSAVTHTGVSAVVALGVRGKDGQRSQRAMPARLVSQGMPYPGQDFALLKVSGHDNLPTLPLGNAGRLSVGDNLYIDGFPGTVTDSDIFTEQSRLAPTFTDGLLSAFRTTDKNVPYLQTQAPAYHGNSGGPVLDGNGTVVGTLIAGAADPNTGQLVAGEQFVLPAGVVAHELAGQGVHPVTGAVTTEYDTALRDYFSGFYRWAVADFQQVLAAFPDHPYAAQYIKLARQQMADGRDRTPPPSSFPWLAVLLALALALAIGGTLIVRSRSRSRPAPAAQPAGAAAWPPPPAPGWPPPPPPPPPMPPYAQPAPPGQPVGLAWPPPSVQPMAPAANPGWVQPPPARPMTPKGGPRWPPPSPQSPAPQSPLAPPPGPLPPGPPASAAPAPPAADGAGEAGAAAVSG